MNRLLLLISLFLLTGTQLFAVDFFDRHTTYWLKQAAKNEAQPSLSSTQVASLKTLGAGIDSPCVVIQTDQGNWTKALISWGFRRTPEKKLVPVLMIDRYVTYDAALENQTIATGKNVMLFDGFAFNFDLGQVVPAGHGEDIIFTERLLKPINEAKLYPVNGSLLPEDETQANTDPLDHDGILPRDFAGEWKIDSDGRLLGRWVLKAEQGGNIYGQFFSSETGSVYPVKGKVRGQTNRLVLQMTLANSSPEVQLYLWSKDKAKMAGTLTLQERVLGIYAIRTDVKEADPKEATEEKTVDDNTTEETPPKNNDEKPKAE